MTKTPELWTFPERLRIAADYITEATRYYHADCVTAEIVEWSPDQLRRLADALDAEHAHRETQIAQFAIDLFNAAPGNERKIADAMIAEGWRKP